MSKYVNFLQNLVNSVKYVSMAWIKEQLMNYLVATNRSVILEGPPIYMFPSRDIPGQSLNTEAFRRGWEIAEGILQDSVLGARTTHHLLVDEFNNAQKDVSDKDVEMFVGEIFSGQQEVLRRRDRVARESDFAGEGNSCGRMDAKFQLGKFETAGDQYPLLIIIHPTDFQGQQRAMLEFLLKEMKDSQRFSGLTKERRRQVISDSYLHVWIGEQGIIESITEPVWNGQRFDFREVEYG